MEEKCGIKVDDVHEHHTGFNFNGVAVENHYDFINTKAHRDAPKIEARLKALAEKGCKEIEVQGARISSFSRLQRHILDASHGTTLCKLTH